MLLPVEVRPFLMDEDPDVRAHAIRYFEAAPDPAPVTQDDLWAAIDRHGRTKGPDGQPRGHHMVRSLVHFPATEASTERILEALRTEQDPDVRSRLLLAAAELPAGALRRLLDDPAIDRRLSWEEAAELEEEVTLSRASFTELEGTLDVCAALLERDGDLGGRMDASPHYHRAERVLRALARDHEQAGERALAFLRGPAAPRGSVAYWLETFAAGLFAWVRLPTVEARILDILGEDDDFRTEVAIEALVHLGTPEVVAAVEAGMASRGDAFFTYGIGIIGRINRPESEAALVRLLRHERNASFRSLMASSLADLCPTDPEALETLTRMVLEGDHDATDSLDKALLAARKMAGWAPPDPAAWKARAKPWRWDPIELVRQALDEHRVGPGRAGPILVGLPTNPAPQRKKAPKKLC